MKNHIFLKILLACYFAANLLARWEIVFSVNLLLTLVVSAALGLLFFSITVFPRFLRYPLWGFAFTFPLYGCPGPLYTSAHVFEFLLSAQSLALLVVSIRCNRSLVKGNLISFLFLLYLTYSFFSILVFPAYEYKILLHPKLFYEGWIHVLYSNNWTSFYSIAGINRLGLFIISALLITCQEDAARIFKGVFVSMMTAGVLAATLGLLHQYDIIYLGFSESRHEGRLQSVFSHPICFSMYMTITSPFVFYGFLLENIRSRWKYSLSLVIIVSVIALVFSASRASWLVYPLTLMSGGLCLFYVQKYRRLSVKSVALFSVIVLVVIVAGYSLRAHYSIYSKNDIKESDRQGVSAKVLKTRFVEILNPKVRARIAQDALSMIKEAPIFGLGFESYGWHISILSQIPQSDFSRERKELLPWGSPHNFYLTHLVNGGIVALVLWLTVAGVVCSLLVADILVNKHTDNLPVLLCIFSFHIYGLAESMQPTPIIWFTILLCIAYAITIDENILPDRLFVFLRRWSVVCGILVLLGGVAYAANFQSWRLAEKYGLSRYSAPAHMDQIYYSGFYTPQTTPIGMTRWMGKRGSIEIVDDGVMEFYIVCEHPDIHEEPVIVTVAVDGKVIDEVAFLAKGIKKRQYFFSEVAVGQRLNITVSRTWNPQKFEEKWGSIRGVAVSAPHYFSEIPENGIGFSVWERMVGQKPEWAQADQQYRWCGKSATLRIDDTMQRHGFEVFLRSRHPDVIEKPVEVQLFADEDLVDTIILSASDWQRLAIGREKLVGKKALTFSVSRTWNPQLMGISTDDRNLGIAVAVP